MGKLEDPSLFFPNLKSLVLWLRGPSPTSREWNAGTADFVLRAALPYSLRNLKIMLDGWRCYKVLHSLEDAGVVAACSTLQERVCGFTLESLTFMSLVTPSNRVAMLDELLRDAFPLLFEQYHARFIADKGPTSRDSRRGHEQSLFTLVCSPNGLWAATSSSDGTVILWSIKIGSAVWELPILPPTGPEEDDFPRPFGNQHRQGARAAKTDLTALAFSKDSDYLASYGSRLIVYDVRAGNVVAVRSGCGGYHSILFPTAKFAAWSHDGLGGLLAFRSGGAVYLWDTARWEELPAVSRFQKHYDAGGDFSSIAFSHDSRRLLLVTACSRYRGGADWTSVLSLIWDLKTGIVRPLRLEGITAARFCPVNSTIVVTWSVDGIIRTWNTETATVLTCFGKHQQPVQSSSPPFSSDGTRVLSRSNDGYTAIVWDIFTGERVLSVGNDAHTSGEIVQACFSPDGEYIATASGIFIRLWRAMDGACLGVFTEYQAPVSHLVFSRDAETLCSGAEDGSVCIRQMRDMVLPR
ncbi:quinon protein alcohol dehydrogenase-like superfamily [Cerioporus squamosus]|nr:quinon protein alcohol dehydrogenase-like superfamily [Cerioporus squamosus]